MAIDDRNKNNRDEVRCIKGLSLYVNQTFMAMPRMHHILLIGIHMFPFRLRPEYGVQDESNPSGPQRLALRLLGGCADKLNPS